MDDDDIRAGRDQRPGECGFELHDMFDQRMRLRRTGAQFAEERLGPHRRRGDADRADEVADDWQVARGGRELAHRFDRDPDAPALQPLPGRQARHVGAAFVRLLHDARLGRRVAEVDADVEYLGLDGGAERHADGFEAGQPGGGEGEAGHRGGIQMRLGQAVAGTGHDLLRHAAHAAAGADHRRTIIRLAGEGAQQAGAAAGWHLSTSHGAARPSPWWRRFAGCRSAETRNRWTV